MADVDPDIFRQNTIDDGYEDFPIDPDAPSRNPITGGFAFGEISGEVAEIVGCSAGNVWLSQGRQFGGGGHGIAHLLYKHAYQMGRDGFQSVQDFVLWVLSRFDAIHAYQGRLTLVRNPSGDVPRTCIVAVEWREADGAFGVVTGYPLARKDSPKGEIVWKR